MKSVFEKKDLQTGMLVQTINGEIYLFINDCFISNGGFNLLVEYNNDLTTTSDYPSQYDIVKVYKPLKEIELIPSMWNKGTLNSNLLWERDRQNNTNNEPIIEIEKYKDDFIEFAKFAKKNKSKTETAWEQWVRQKQGSRCRIKVKDLETESIHDLVSIDVDDNEVVMRSDTHGYTYNSIENVRIFYG